MVGFDDYTMFKHAFEERHTDTLGVCLIYIVQYFTLAGVRVTCHDVFDLLLNGVEQGVHQMGDGNNTFVRDFQRLRLNGEFGTHNMPARIRDLLLGTNSGTTSQVATLSVLGEGGSNNGRGHRGRKRGRGRRN